MKVDEKTWEQSFPFLPKRNADWQQIFFISCFALSILFLISAYQAIPTLASFGHDEVHYYTSFYFKLGEDGRWLNYFLHGFLRKISAHAWAAFFLVASWMLFFRLAISLEIKTGYAALVASTALTALPFVEQSLWPATTAPAVIVLLICSLFVHRNIAYPIIYVFAGTLIFGTLQSFYFLLPLFFLKDFLLPTSDGKNLWKLLFSHLFWWVVGAVAGVLVMSSMLWVLTGHFGVQPADWRRVQPIHDFHGVIRNVLHAIHAFSTYSVQLAKSTGADRAWFIYCIAAIIIVRFRSLTKSTAVALLIASVGAAFFVFSIPLAPIIQSRSLIALSTAFIVAIILIPGRTVIGQIVGAILLLTVNYNNSANAADYLRKHQSVSNFYQQKIQQLLPAPIESYSAIALFGHMDGSTRIAQTFNSPPLMHGIIYAMGAKDYQDCRQGLDSRCNEIESKNIIAKIALTEGELSLSIDEKNVANIRYQQRTAPAP